MQSELLSSFGLDPGLILIFMMLLMVFVLFNDIRRIVMGG